MGLILNDVTIVYDNKTVIENLSLEFQTGKVNAIIGRNGSGKSTLLKAIMNIKKTKLGEIYLDQKKINNYSTKQLAQRIAYLPQIHQDNLFLDVETIVKMGRFPYQKFSFGYDNQTNELVNEALRKFNLEDYAKTKYHLLSGGERQRVWLALLFCQKADYILLDEPTTFLDITYQIELLNSLKAISNELNKTIITVLHDINLAAKYADYIYIMQEKSVKYAGRPEEVLTERIIKETFGVTGEILKRDGKIIFVP